VETPGECVFIFMNQ